MGMFPAADFRGRRCPVVPEAVRICNQCFSGIGWRSDHKAAAINQFMEYFLNPENGGGYYYDEIGVPTANAVARSLN